MRPSIFTWVMMLTIFVLACGPENTEKLAEKDETSPTTTPTLTDVYQTWKASRSDSLPAQSITEAGKLYPVDEAPLDTTLFILRESLRDAVRNKDILPILEALSPQCKVSFGGEGGVDGFIDIWGLESEEKTQSSPLWEALGKVLSNGGTFSDQGNMFTAPYSFSNWPQSVDAFTHLLVDGAGVRLRKKPTLQSDVLATLSHDIVLLVENTNEKLTLDGETFPWVKVKTLNDDEGYVWGKYLISAIDYRAGFRKKQDNTWHITFFLAGD